MVARYGCGPETGVRATQRLNLHAPERGVRLLERNAHFPGFVPAPYDFPARGAPGFRQVLVNAQGRPVESDNPLQRDLQAKTAISGNDLGISP